MADGFPAIVWDAFLWLASDIYVKRGMTGLLLLTEFCQRSHSQKLDEMGCVGIWGW
jgi:hypothetical protein